MLKSMATYFFILIFGFCFGKNLTIIEIPVNDTITIKKTEEVYSYLYLNVIDYRNENNKIDLDIYGKNEYQSHIYGVEYKEDYDNKDKNFVNLVKLYSNEATNEKIDGETYSTFHFHIYLNLAPRYLLFQIATYAHDVTITHIKPSKNTWVIILIVIGVICLSAICFFLGRISKSCNFNFNFAQQQPVLLEVPPEFARPHQDGIQPNIRESQHQEMQSDNIQSQQQQNPQNNNTNID